MNNFEQSSKELGEMVIIEAQSIYRALGFEDDFDVTYIGLHMVIFGNNNQIRWSPATGFELVNNTITKDFAEKWYQHYNGMHPQIKCR